MCADDGSPQLWAEIGDYVDDVAKSGTLSQSEMARLRRLARQQSEPLRRVYAVWKHSHSRFVNNVMGLLKQVSFVGDVQSSLGDAKSSLGDAESSLGDAKSSLGDATSSLGDAKSSLGDG